MMLNTILLAETTKDNTEVLKLRHTLHHGKS